MPIAPVILPRLTLGGIVVAGLLFSGKLAALQVDEADLRNRPDGYSASLKLAERIRIGNSTASTKVSHLNTIITSTIFQSFFNLSALTELSPLSLDPKIETKINKNQPLWSDSYPQNPPAQTYPRRVKNPHPTLPIHALIKLHIRADLLLYSPFQLGIKDLNLRCITGIP